MTRNYAVPRECIKFDPTEFGASLIHRIAQKQSQIVERDVELAVKMMLDQMAACLAGGGRIEIRAFGSFSLRLRPARVARNPRTGTPVSLPARCRPKIQAGEEAARTRRLRVSWTVRSAAARGRIRGSAGALRPVTRDRRPSCALMHYFMGIDHERCSPAPWTRRSGPHRGLGWFGNEPVPGLN